jgi:tetratricopeptide (TPR) repeat protein
MRKRNTLFNYHFQYLTHISILIIVISSLAIISLANHAYVIGQKGSNVISNPNDMINNKKSVKEIKKDLIQIDQSLKVNPNNVTALIDNGLGLGILHKYSEALTYFDKALSIDANNVNALIG